MKINENTLWLLPWMGTLLMGCLLWGCSIDDELEECTYNARIDFSYTYDNRQNVLSQYIHRMNDYLFNANDTLIRVSQRNQRGTLGYVGLMLPPGKYSLVSWGNMGEASIAVPVKLGETSLSEMLLYLNNPFDEQTRAPVSIAQGFHRNADPLYFGRTSFEVRPVGISRAWVDMTHSHCKLSILVKWKSAAPPDTLSYHMELCNLNGAYRFTSKYEIPNPYLPVGYATGGYAIPEEGAARVNHRVDTEMGVTRSLSGNFVTFRLANDDHPLFRLYGNGELVMKEIDLYKYFRTMQIDLDQNLRQEFDLVMEVQKDGTVIVSSAKVSDWNEGENIGTGI